MRAIMTSEPPLRQAFHTPVSSPAHKPGVVAVQQGDDWGQPPRSHHLSCCLIAARQSAQRPHGSLFAGQHLQTSCRQRSLQTALKWGRRAGK